MEASPRSELTSPRHPLLKRFRRALERGELTPDGCCAVEGLHLVEEAMRSRAEVTALLAARSAVDKLIPFEAASNGRARSYVLPDRLFRSLAGTENPQGIAALVRLPEFHLEERLARAKPLAVVLAGLQDPGNLGTILRALEAFGGAACLLERNTVSPFNAKAVRASAGSLFRLPLLRNLNSKAVFSLCRQYGLATVALTPHARKPLTEVDLRRGVTFLIGREASGLPAELGAGADEQARIPLAVPVESLNAAMAASVALYEAARQRGFPQQ